MATEGDPASDGASGTEDEEEEEEQEEEQGLMNELQHADGGGAEAAPAAAGLTSQYFQHMELPFALMHAHPPTHPAPTPHAQATAQMMWGRALRT
jgi:hypothetical protein